MKRALRLLVLIAFALALAGCGGDGTLSKEEYEDEASAVLEDLREPPGEVAPEEFDERFDTAADELDELEPPEDAAAAHNRLVRGLRTLARLQRAATAAITGDPADLQEKLNEVANTDTGIEGALSDLKNRGYRLPSLYGVKNQGPLPETGS